MTSTKLRVAAAVVATGLLLAGTSCSKSKSGSDTTTTTAKTEESTTTAAEVDDQEAADASLISADDVPTGFDVVDSDPDSSSDSPFLGVPECADFEDAIQASEDEQTAKATISFENANKDTIENKVEIYSSEEVAADSADVASDPGFPACIEAAFKQALETSGMPADASIDSMSATRAKIATADELKVDSANAFTIDLTITVQGQTVNMTTGTVMITSGRSLTQVSTQSTSGPIEIAATVKAAAKALVANAPA